MERRGNQYVIIDLLDFNVYDLWKNLKICVQISHGMIDFVGRYKEYAESLNELGITVAGADHLGHGHARRRAVGIDKGSKGHGNLRGVAALGQKLQKRQKVGHNAPLKGGIKQGKALLPRDGGGGKQGAVVGLLGKQCANISYLGKHPVNGPLLAGEQV